ncbi:MAG: hypothetical protein IT379_11860 [Deltaproteobacteria bacterium]|nr:hypothetical protein [Deltaproteobacteria bacterium]
MKRPCLLGLAGVLAGCLPTAWPDPVPVEVGVDSSAAVTMTLANYGDDPLAMGDGRAGLVVDGTRIVNYEFARWPFAERDFFLPGGQSTITTSLRLGGVDRRVAVLVDPDHVVAEVNEWQNVRTRALVPPAQEVADPAVTDLRVFDGDLQARVTNVGTVAADAQFVEVLVRLDGMLVHSMGATLPALAPGETVTLSTGYVLPRTGRVRVSVTFYEENLDGTNDARDEVLPDPPLAVYGFILTALGDEIVWWDDRDPHPFRDWSTRERQDLVDAIIGIYEGRPSDLPGPPPVLDKSLRIAYEDGWRIYISHVAQSLWADVEGGLGWNLGSMPSEQRQVLFDSRDIVGFCGRVRGTCTLDGNIVGYITPWSPRIAYEFLASLGLIRGTHRDTILALTDWMRGHLVHASGSQGANESNWEYPGHPPIDRILYPHDYPRDGVLFPRPHLTQGCWGTTGLYAALLRTVNIPVTNSDANLPGGNHRRPLFPSVGLTMVHGDDPYFLYVRPSTGSLPPLAIASASLLYTFTEYETRFEHPVLDCADDGSRCNTDTEQRDYNSRRDKLQLAYDFRTDALAMIYIDSGSAALDDVLRGLPAGDEVVEYAQPFFTLAQRSTMIDGIVAWVRQQGDGDLSAGRERVRVRWRRFEDFISTWPPPGGL